MSISVGEKLVCDPRTLENFNNLLSCAKERLQRDSSRFASGDFWKIFEGEVCKALDKSKEFVGVPDWNIEYIGGHKFPDIVARINKNQALGIEVKTLSTRNDSWKVMGGSIMESTRIPDVSRIHVFCGKQKPFEIKYRSFEDCVEDVAVTHSPRYMLDMNVSREKSLFKRLGKSYDEIRHMKNPFDAFRTYMVDSKMKRNAISDGEDLWWFSPSIDEFSKLDLAEEKFASSLVNNKVKFWNKLSADEKQEIKIEMLIASPSVLEGDYEYACQWLLQRKGVVCPSFRDNFSAGGRTVVNGVNVPQVIGKINEWKADIAKVFNKKELPQQYFEHWKTRVLSIGKFSSAEKDVLRKIVAYIGKNIVY